MTDIGIYQQLPSLAASAFVSVFLLCMLLWIRLLNGPVSRFPVSRLQGWRRHVARAPLLVLIVGFVLYHDFIQRMYESIPIVICSAALRLLCRAYPGRRISHCVRSGILVVLWMGSA